MSPSTPAPLSYLFVPGNRPERFTKALASGSDRIIIDLEDAVAPADKAAARAVVAQWMGDNPAHAAQVLIRINDAATTWYADDMAMAQAVQALCIMLPKCEAPGQVADVLAHLPTTATTHTTTVLPLIETARGLLAVQAIAAAPGVARLAFGSLDYMADLDLDLPARSVALDYAAAHIAIASRAAGLPSPLAGVTPELDAERVRADMLAAKALGFGAKMCIHPAQVAAVHTALAPSAQELAWAQRVLQAWAASSGGAIQLDGKMVDRPVVLKAERITAQAARTL
jgi:citrate lyase subunit beta / citryl-CoA lyase